MEHFKQPKVVLAPSACLKTVGLDLLQVLQHHHELLALVPIGESKLNRFRTPVDRASIRNGWHVLPANGVPAGAFGT